MKCPDCGAEMVLRETKKFTYPKNKRPRKFYGCSNWPKCNATHGAHPDGKPLGFPADSATKLWRSKTHKKIDELLALTGWTQNEYYKWISEQLGIEEKKVHVGNMNISQCTIIMSRIDEEIAKRHTPCSKP